MAYGTHHFITNFKFQCHARESFYFRSGPDGVDHWKSDLDNIVLLTHEGYCKNLAPAGLGEKLAIFMSIGEITRSTVLLCFRVLREDGTPISCGYQRIIVIDRSGTEMLPVPQSMTQFGMIREELADFIGAATKGGRRLKDIFPESLRGAAREVACSDRTSGFVDVTDAGVCWDPEMVRPGEGLGDDGGLVAFMFPGQGAFSLSALRDLYVSAPRFHPAFATADALARQHLGHSFLALVSEDGEAERRAALEACPDLDQIGIFLAGVLSAELLKEEGIEPNLVFGHSFGEVAAFAVAGAYDIATGLEIVCRRVAALRRAGIGAMAALSCGVERLRPLLDTDAGRQVELAVVNGPQQCVVSGRSEAVSAFIEAALGAGIGATLLRSRYPFHSSLLAGAAEVFAADLRTIAAGRLRVPVYSPVDACWYRDEADVRRILPAHLTRQLHFGTAVDRLAAEGTALFVECGVGDILTKLVKRTLPKDSPAVVLNALGFGETIEAARSRLRIALTQMVSEPLPGTASPVGEPATDQAGEPAHDTAPSPVIRRSEPEPIAIVGAGAVLPGIANLDDLWSTVLNGVSHIVDMGDIDPDWRADFLSPGAIQPDKAYSVKSGYVAAIPDDGMPCGAQRFAAFTRAQRMLAAALAQALQMAGMTTPAAGEVGVVLGSTADGYSDTEAAHLRTSIEQILAGIDASGEDRRALLDAVGRALDGSGTPQPAVSQHRACLDVIRALVGPEIEPLIVDAACASSLYAVDLGLRRLRSGDWNVALVGGLYETGPGNQCLFSQFGGLSATDSRPFDAQADGVIFGEGAAVLVLKRLSDALAAQDTVLGVIRSSGLSSDGKSPAVNVPQAEGQELAMRRAYADGVVDPQSIQYIEAHATATPVGDATEFSAMARAFAGRHAALPPIALGSIKALLGHTGWVAGIASLLKVCLAMRAGIIPGQPKISGINPKLPLATSPFTIPTEAGPWPENRNGLPRRAAVSGFGFGGTNAHVVVEEFAPAYHGALTEQRGAGKDGGAEDPPPARIWAVVGVGSLFPCAERETTDDAAEQGPACRFPSSAFVLPKGKRLLPDVTDSMDGSQFIALRLAEQALGSVADWTRFSDDTAVVIGMEGRTGSGVLANERLYRDRLDRVVGAAAERAGDGRLAVLLGEVNRAIEARSRPSTPYTLPGVMPNVTSGRVANVYRLRGPNFVVDTGRSSFFDAVTTATRLLADGSYRLVLAGAVNTASALPAALTAAPSEPERPLSDAGIMLALTTVETAERCKLPVLALLDLDATAAPDTDAQDAAGEPVNYRGATGAATVAAALRGAVTARAMRAVAWSRPSSAGTSSAVWRFRPPEPEPEPKRAQAAVVAATAAPSASGFVTGTPIAFHEPRLVASPSNGGRCDLHGRHVLFVTDRAELIAEAEAAGELAGLTYTVLTSRTADGRLAAELGSDDALKRSLGVLDAVPFDCIVAVTTLADTGPTALLERSYAEQKDFTTLLFGVARHAYEALKSGRVPMACLCLGGHGPDGRLHPASGLAAGFMKSLIRELPASTTCVVGTDETGLAAGLQHVAVELGQGSLGGRATEVWYIDGRRHRVKLVPRSESKPGDAQLSRESVVLVTGGGRGVTAVMAEAMLERFGCTAVLLGRTDLDRVPRRFLDMDDAAFAAHEAEFYREGMAAGTGAKIIDLKRQYQGYQAARELKAVIDRLRRLPGRVEYASVDITDADAVDRIVASVAERHGRLDFVVHGAGVQISKRLSSRRLEEFEAVIGTKLSGLSAVHRACVRHFPGRPIGFHLLTSAFSYMGNDGQPDYGAANEAMNRMAAWCDAAGGGRWSTMAWLGWDGIGMTRGSEYSALAAGRGIRGITAPEGKSIITAFLSAPPPSPVSIPLTEGEISLYGVEIVEAHGGPEATGPVTVSACPVSLDRMPHLRAHQVKGMPAVPGTFELELAARAAQALEPGWVVHGFTDCTFHRLLRLRDGEEKQVHTACEKLFEDGGTVRYRVRVSSDFTHESGVVLQKDVVHIECVVHLTRHAPAAVPGTLADLGVEGGAPAPDPYTHPDAPVSHQGLFNHLHDIRLGDPCKEAVFRLGGDRALDTETDHLTPWLLADACLSFSMVEINGQGLMPVFVPLRIGSIRFLPGINDWNVHDRCGTVRLVAPCPRRTPASETAEVQIATWVQAVGGDGRVLMVVDGAVGRLFTMVPPEDGFATEAEVAPDDCVPA